VHTVTTVTKLELAVLLFYASFKKQSYNTIVIVKNRQCGQSGDTATKTTECNAKTEDYGLIDGFA